MSPLKIVIADDHAAVRKSLRLLLECERDIQIVGETADGLETIRMTQALQPDMLLLDITMPQMSGLEVLQYLRNSGHSLGIIMLSNHSEQLYVAAALRLGADAFIAKGAGLEVLAEALQKVRQRLIADRSERPTHLSEAQAACKECRAVVESRVEAEAPPRKWVKAS